LSDILIRVLNSSLHLCNMPKDCPSIVKYFYS
jgi:hypothetical protein